MRWAVAAPIAASACASVWNGAPSVPLPAADAVVHEPDRRPADGDGHRRRRAGRDPREPVVLHLVSERHGAGHAGRRAEGEAAVRVVQYMRSRRPGSSR